MTKNYVLKPIYNDENECINDTLSLGSQDCIVTLGYTIIDYGVLYADLAIRLLHLLVASAHIVHHVVHPLKRKYVASWS